MLSYLPMNRICAAYDILQLVFIYCIVAQMKETVKVIQ